jgi:hypothetical protein
MNRRSIESLRLYFTCSCSVFPCSEFFSCGWRDSNPHASRRQILSLVRLPISPHPQYKFQITNCKFQGFHISRSKKLEFGIFLIWNFPFGAANVGHFRGSATMKRKRVDGNQPEEADRLPGQTWKKRKVCANCSSTSTYTNGIEC